MTLFKDIYESNEIIKDDNRIQMKTTNNIYKLYYKYLKYAIGIFFRYCYKDLTNCVDYSETEYMFSANGTDNDFQLSSAPPVGSELYVGIKTTTDSLYTEVLPSNYTFNSSTKVLTITLPTLSTGTIIYVVPYVIGQFNSTLDFDEQNILSEAMIIPFLEEEQNRNSLLTQKIYGGESKLYSQANHIDSVHLVVEDQRKKVDKLIKEYTYRANPDKLQGLGGEGNL